MPTGKELFERFVRDLEEQCRHALDTNAECRVLARYIRDQFYVNVDIYGE